jgi:Fur family ferric uptake transcriptional regulator
VYTHDKALKALRAAGYRITSQRRAVLATIETCTEHLDAEGIYQRALEVDPSLSLATVYRTIAVLKDTGLIEHRFLTREHTREYYEPLDMPEHYHFTCLNCQRVIEFQSSDVDAMRTKLQQELGVEISHICLCVEGYCKECAEKASHDDKKGETCSR